MFRIDRPIARISSYLELYRSLAVFFHFGEDGFTRKWRHLVVQNPAILQGNAVSPTAAAVKDLLRRWQWQILEHHRTHPMSPCDYDLSAKVKETLRGPGTTQEMNLSVL